MTLVGLACEQQMCSHAFFLGYRATVLGFLISAASYFNFSFHCFFFSLLWLEGRQKPCFIWQKLHVFMSFHIK